MDLCKNKVQNGNLFNELINIFYTWINYVPTDQLIAVNYEWYPKILKNLRAKTPAGSRSVFARKAGI